MSEPKLSKLEFQIMEALWSHGELSIREIQETFTTKRRPAYTTVQTTVYRLEAKGTVHRVRKVGNFHIFAAASPEMLRSEDLSTICWPCSADDHNR